MTFVMWPKTYQVLFFYFPLLLGWGIDPCHRYMFLITPLKSNMYPKKSMVGSTEISLISWSLCWATASFIFVISPHHTPPGTSCQEPSGPSVPRIWTLLELPPMIWRVVGTQRLHRRKQNPTIFEMGLKAIWLQQF